MKTILLFGAGKSATVLINYLLENAASQSWNIVVVDADLELALQKIGNSSNATALSFDINDEALRSQHIQQSDIVISLLPPSLHIKVAESCLQIGRNLLTASYTDDAIKAMQTKIKEAGLLFLYEMGLDPGIDHMSAMQIIDDIHERGGKVTSFKSHCGGLVAPESDDNPWHYKISWNPRNIIMAGKAGAHYRENNAEKKIEYEDLFTADRLVDIPGIGQLSWYANRDSLSYTPLYGLEDAPTFIRTTLRHPDFMFGWKNVIELKLTDETPQYETDGKSLEEVYKEHMKKNGFGEWLEHKLNERFSDTRTMMESLVKLLEVESKAIDSGDETLQSFMTADESGNINEVSVDDMKNKAASFVAQKMHEANLTLKQLFFLGLNDDETIVNKGLCSPADILQFAVERKLALSPGDRDMIVMLHEIEYTINDKHFTVKSSLVVKGEDNLRTGMAKTVGLPLGIAAKLVLNGKLKLNGLHIPTHKEIYKPVLQELEQLGVKFDETVISS